MFMDTSGMSDKQECYVELCRDELLKKKELVLDSLRGSMGPFEALMGGYIPPYGGGCFMGVVISWEKVVVVSWEGVLEAPWEEVVVVLSWEEVSEAWEALKEVEPWNAWKMAISTTTQVMERCKKPTTT
jgi:hypothetical protein